jgi:hypothetical protein
MLLRSGDWMALENQGRICGMPFKHGHRWSDYIDKMAEDSGRHMIL